MLSPPTSPMFSPSVRRPFTQVLPSSSGQKVVLLGQQRSPSCSNFGRSASVHQLRSAPV
jgi:hypothetical protein